MKKFYLFLIGSITCIITQAQLNESFNDGNFTVNPPWIGSTTEWTVVASSDVAAGATNSNTLRLSAGGGAATDYLSTQVLGSWGTLGQTWGFWWGRRGQTATDANRSYVWLYASESDVTSATVDGYRVRFGDDVLNDEIFIESITNGVATTILTSTLSVPNDLTDIGFLVRVNRSVAGVFTLFTSVLPLVSGTGDVATAQPNVINTPILQGTVVNNDYTDFTNGYVSVAATHTSSSAARAGAEFDQIRLAFVVNAPLPVKFGNIKAYEKLNGIQIDWTSYSEDNLQKYEIERSSDGIHFSSIGSVNALNSLSATHYRFFDPLPLSGLSFYRLRSVDWSGDYSYSNIVRVNLDKASADMVVYPNPVRNGIISLQSSNLMKGMYTVRIFNAGAQQVFTQKIEHSGGTINQTIHLPESLKAGVYNVEMSSGEMRVMNRSVVISQ